MIPSKINKSGKVVWRIYLGQTNGKKLYKQFPTRTEADKFIRKEKIRRNRQGEMAFRSSPEEVATFLEISAMLEPYDASIRQAVEFFIEHQRKTKSPTLLSEAVTKYLSEIKFTLAPPTVGDYRRRLNQFSSFHNELRVDEVINSVRNYLEDHLKKFSRQMVDNDRRALSAFFTWCVDRNMIEENPCLKIKSFLSKKKGKATVFLPKEVKTILTKLDQHFDPHVAAYVVLSFFGGVRPMEFYKKINKNGKRQTVTLTWEDIDLKTGEVAISEDLSKTNLYRTVQNKTLKKWIRWIQEQSDTPLEGNLIHYRFRHKWLAWRREHTPKLTFSPDILRHSFGTYRLKILKSAGEVALEMGNSEAIVKRHYLDAKRSLKDAESYWSLTPDEIIN